MANKNEETAKTKAEGKKPAKKANSHLRDTILADVHDNQRKGEMAKIRINKMKEGKL